MINAALEHIAGQLNRHLKRTSLLTEDGVVLSNLHEQDGSPVPLVANKIVLFLAGIERDSVAHRAREGSGMGNGPQLQAAAPIHLNLLLMCAANFSGSNYKEALKYLSSTITFFQAKPVLDHHNTPDLDPRLERLVLSIENLSSSELYSFWGIHGSRYLPSVLYRIRMVTLSPEQVDRRELPINEADVGVGA